MFHSFRTASFGLTGSLNRFIKTMEESHNGSERRERRGERTEGDGETQQRSSGWETAPSFNYCIMTKSFFIDDKSLIMKETPKNNLVFHVVDLQHGSSSSSF